MTKLTIQKALFCKEYIKDFNATQAAIRADYSEKTAQEQSSRLLSSVIVQEELARLMSARNERLEVDADWVLKEAAESYKYNKKEIIDNDGNPKMINAASASKFLELVGKHSDVRAFESNDGRDKETPPLVVEFNVNSAKDDIEITRGADES